MSRTATRRAERAATLRKRLIAVTTAAVMGLGLAIGGITPAMASNNGSDGPTPYTVDSTGITLPEGVTFRDNGHVNIRTTAGDRGVHFEAQNWPADHPKKFYIGKSFIPWSAFGLTGSFCVTWVQIDLYNQHFGEGGQAPVCVGPEDPEEPELPTLNTFTPSWSDQAITCASPGWYTLDNELVEGDSAVQWYVFVGADKPADLTGYTAVDPALYGTQITVNSAQTVHVRAEANLPEFGIDGENEHTFSFTAPVDCTPPACIPDEFIFYTYISSGAGANTGVVTVTQPSGNFTDELCAPLYVTAAAWSFDKIDNIWTQTLVVANRINGGVAITEVGAYEYGAPVACGQGDIYASRTGFPVPSPLLLGPNQPAWPAGDTPWPFTETFLHSMGFEGTPGNTYMVTGFGCNGVEPVLPAATVIEKCGTDGVLTITTSPYISYIVRDSEGKVVEIVEFDAENGVEQVVVADAKTGSFMVTPVALGGYILTGYDAADPEWSPDLGDRTECPISVRLGFTYMEECAPDPTYTFRVRNPLSEYVPYTYTVAGNASLNGSGIAAPGDSTFTLAVERTNPAQSYTVTLRWGDGTTILTGSNPKASGDDKVCTLAVQPVTAIECDTVGSYTVPRVLGVIWSINGEVVQPGTYEVDAATSFTLRATAASGYVLYPNGERSETRDFPLTFGAPEDCQLPEFPITNASIGFLEPTCDLGQRLDPSAFVVDDPEFARFAPELSTLTGAEYSVVFEITGEDWVFFNSSEPVPGRTVSSDGQTLTFTGTLAGRDLSDCVVLPVVDPFDFTDTCVEQNFTLIFVEGLTYSVTINDDEPFVAVFDGEPSKTFPVNQGDNVSVVPSANPGYILGPDQPSPLDRQFAEYGVDDCQLPELPNWPANATATNQVCTPLGLTSGAITVQQSTGPVGNLTPVRYYLAYGTAQQQELTAPVTSVAPGSYTVTAVASISTDSINDAGNTAEFPVTVGAAADQECDLPTLAFTGASGALQGVGAVALLLMLVGFGAMAARRQQV